MQGADTVYIALDNSGHRRSSVGSDIEDDFMPEGLLMISRIHRKRERPYESLLVRVSSPMKMALAGRIISVEISYTWQIKET